MPETSKYSKLDLFRFKLCSLGDPKRIRSSIEDADELEVKNLLLDLIEKPNRRIGVLTGNFKTSTTIACQVLEHGNFQNLDASELFDSLKDEAREPRIMPAVLSGLLPSLLKRGLSWESAKDYLLEKETFKPFVERINTYLPETFHSDVLDMLLGLKDKRHLDDALPSLKITDNDKKIDAIKQICNSGRLGFLTKKFDLSGIGKDLETKVVETAIKEEKYSTVLDSLDKFESLTTEEVCELLVGCVNKENGLAPGLNTDALEQIVVRIGSLNGISDTVRDNILKYMPEELFRNLKAIGENTFVNSISGESFLASLISSERGGVVLAASDETLEQLGLARVEVAKSICSNLPISGSSRSRDMFQLVDYIEKNFDELKNDSRLVDILRNLSSELEHNEFSSFVRINGVKEILLESNIKFSDALYEF